MIHSASLSAKGMTACALLALAPLMFGCSGGGSAASPAPVQQTPAVTQSQAQATVIAKIANNEILSIKSEKGGFNNYGDDYARFVAGSSSLSCVGGGTRSFTVMDSGTPHVPDGGDSVEETYDNCYTELPGVGIDGTTYDGSIAWTWLATDGDSTSTSTWSATYSTAFRDYDESTLSGHVIYNGTFIEDLVSTDATQKSATWTADLLETVTPQETVKYTGLAIGYTVNAAGTTSISLQEKYAVDYAAPSASDVLDFGLPYEAALMPLNSASPGSYEFTFSTATPFTFDAGGVPTGGVLNITFQATGDVTGKMLTVPDKSVATTIHLKWTVVSSTVAKMESDLDNDGVYETSFTFDPSSLSSL